MIPNKPDGTFGETFNPPVRETPLFTDFPSFRLHLLGMTQEKESEKDRAKIINSCFADPKDSETVSHVIDRFEEGFHYLIKLENL